MSSLPFSSGAYSAVNSKISCQSLRSLSAWISRATEIQLWKTTFSLSSPFLFWALVSSFHQQRVSSPSEVDQAVIFSTNTSWLLAMRAICLLWWIFLWKPLIWGKFYCQYGSRKMFYKIRKGTRSAFVDLPNEVLYSLGWSDAILCWPSAIPSGLLAWRPEDERWQTRNKGKPILWLLATPE